MRTHDIAEAEIVLLCPYLTYNNLLDQTPLGKHPDCTVPSLGGKGPAARMAPFAKNVKSSEGWARKLPHLFLTVNVRERHSVERYTRRLCFSCHSQTSNLHTMPQVVLVLTQNHQRCTRTGVCYILVPHQRQSVRQARASPRRARQPGPLPLRCGAPQPARDDPVHGVGLVAAARRARTRRRDCRRPGARLRPTAALLPRHSEL